MRPPCDFRRPRIHVLVTVQGTHGAVCADADRAARCVARDPAREAVRSTDPVSGRGQRVSGAACVRQVLAWPRTRHEAMPEKE